MLRSILSLVSIIAAVAIMAAAAEAAPSIDRTSPDWIGVVRPYALLHVPSSGRGGDVQCYSARTGKSYVQRYDKTAGLYWTGAHGRAVAGFDRVNHDFISFARFPILCASWQA